jgi:hypothetical protein
MVARREVLAFANCMELKLRRNDHKGGWELEGLRDLLRRLREEVDELEAAIRVLPNHGSMPNRVARDTIVAEAADIANLAMMIADNVGGL